VQQSPDWDAASPSNVLLHKPSGSAAPIPKPLVVMAKKTSAWRKDKMTIFVKKKREYNDTLE